MSEMHVAIGSTDGFRYIGVQPPLSKEQEENLRHAAYVSNSLPTGRFNLVVPARGEEYSQTTIGVSLPGEQADQKVLDQARAVARVLEKTEGVRVTVHEEIIAIGAGHFLFGGEGSQQG